MSLWASARLVLHAIAEAVERDGARSVDLRGLLDWPDPGDRKQTVAGGAVDRLLPDAPNDLRNHLVTCAATRGVGRPLSLPLEPG